MQKERQRQKKHKTNFKEEKSSNDRFLQSTPRYTVKAKSQWHKFLDFADKKNTQKPIKKCSK